MPPLPQRSDLLPALRVTTAVVVPLVVLRLTGHIGDALYAAFGAFASIYSRRGTHVDRAVMQLQAAALLVACITAGAAVSALDRGVWPAVVGTAAAAAAGSACSDRWRWLPPGPLFAVFAFGACAGTPATWHRVPEAFGIGAAAAAFAVLVGALGAAHAGSRRTGRGPAAYPARTGREVAARAGVSAGSALVAAGAAAGLGLHHSYWAAVAAVVPWSAGDTVGRLTRAWHRFAGTAGGLLVAAPLVLSGPHGWTVVALVGLLQVLAELFVLRHYGVAMLFVTPMAVLMPRLVTTGPAWPLLRDRGVTTAIGVVVGVAAVMAVHDRRAED
ncbi:fusaric acid resistance family protein [Motilibacter peucedani]|uniref:Fusaric acid resistance family protein n=1 Tax=Motilibacter peucedani TaxID=598650 RepID=A0A420XKS2_9ACTN|nr:FUSC family protein [Motilibacter peucedani]RKS68037.1 fusaric acid resistance family protein [Motilibacter peucedani]